MRDTITQQHQYHHHPTMSNNNVVTPNEQDDDEIMDQLIQEAEDSRAEVGQLEMVVEAIGNERDEFRRQRDELEVELGTIRRTIILI